MSKTVHLFNLTFGWLFSILFIATAIFMAFAEKWAMLPFFLITAILILPPLQKWIPKVTPIHKIVIIVGVLFLSQSVSSYYDEKLQQQERQLTIQKAEEDRQQKLAEFESQKEGIIKNLENLIEKNRYDEAILISQKYVSFGDQKLAELHYHISQKHKEGQRQIELERLKSEFSESREDLIELLHSASQNNDYAYPLRKAGKYLDVADQDFIKKYKKLKSEYDELKMEEQNRIAQAKEKQKLMSIDVEKAKLEAYTLCQIYMKENLKAPRTAKFEWYSGDQVLVSTGNEFFTVQAYVDAQNSFGAMLRTKYFCKLQYNGGGSNGWNLIEFDIEQ